MNWFDLVLLVLALLAVSGGLRVGLVARAFSWVGLVIGALLATRTVPFALDLLAPTGPSVRFLVAVLALAVTLSVCASLLGSVGARLRRGMGDSVLSRLDRVLGGVAGLALVLGLTWFLLPTMADVPGSLAREARTSTVATTLRDVAPQPPDAARALRDVVAATRFPEVLGDLTPTPAGDEPPGSRPVSDEVVQRTTQATLRVSASGCDRRYEGTGVVLDTDTVVTNAHVVAGAEEVLLRGPDGVERSADVVAFDAGRDLAVLEATDLGIEPLPLGEPEAGAEGVSVGYPGGTTAPRVASLRIEERRSAVGRDIYGAEPSEREVLFLAAELEQGDSGSPVVNADGEVVGVVFAVSPDQPTTAFALDRAEVEEVLASSPVTGASGRCLR